MRFKALQDSHVGSLGQENLMPALVLGENVPGCSAGLSHMGQQAAASFLGLTGSTTQQQSFSDSIDTRDTGNCQQPVRLWWLVKLQGRLSYPTLQKLLRSYGRQTIAKPDQDTSSALNEPNGNYAKVRHTVNNVPCIHDVDDPE